MIDTNSYGYKKLYASVQKDCEKENGEVHSNGCCDCISPKHCFHNYCDTFKWVLDRAEHYAQKLGLKAEDVLDGWERDRDYWYMNYYQEANQPLIENDNVHVFSTVEELHNALLGSDFRCPSCNAETDNPYKCSKCGWNIHGLFRGLDKSTYIYVKEKLRGEEIFMPIKWESK